VLQPGELQKAVSIKPIQYNEKKMGRLGRIVPAESTEMLFR
jgi:hypothetical protein